MVGTHKTPERSVGRRATAVAVALSSAEQVRSCRQEFLCVQRSEAKNDADGATGRSAPQPVGLAQTLHEGARVTESMAAAAASELLGSPLDIEQL